MSDAGPSSRGGQHSTHGVRENACFDVKGKGRDVVLLREEEPAMGSLSIQSRGERPRVELVYRTFVDEERDLGDIMRLCDQELSEPYVGVGRGAELTLGIIVGPQVWTRSDNSVYISLFSARLVGGAWLFVADCRPHLTYMVCSRGMALADRRCIAQMTLSRPSGRSCASRICTEERRTEGILLCSRWIVLGAEGV